MSRAKRQMPDFAIAVGMLCPTTQRYQWLRVTFTEFLKQKLSTIEHSNLTQRKDFDWKTDKEQGVDE